MFVFTHSVDDVSQGSDRMLVVHVHRGLCKSIQIPTTRRRGYRRAGGPERRQQKRSRLRSSWAMYFLPFCIRRLIRITARDTRTIDGEVRRGRDGSYRGCRLRVGHCCRSVASMVQGLWRGDPEKLVGTMSASAQRRTRNTKPFPSSEHV